jgi:hypothetical protein
MKVSEYIPFYGLLFNFKYQTAIEGKEMTVKEMFDNYPDFELTEIHIAQLFFFDLASLSKALRDDYFTPDTVVPYLRELFDNYRMLGGNPLEWLFVTIEQFFNNPENYKVELRASIEKALVDWNEIYEKKTNEYLYLNSQPTETITDKLRNKLGELGFFELSKVKQLSEQNKQKLVELLSTNKMPYGIAMFDYLGFCENLDREQGTKYRANKVLSKLYNEKAKDGTSAKHYRRSLIKPSSRYKAGDYKEIVKTDYQNLK